MRVVVAVDVMSETGGMELASHRFATALTERGHEVRLTHERGAPHREAIYDTTNCRFPESTADVAPWARSIAPFRPDVCMAMSTSALLLQSLHRLAPTVLSCQLLEAACAEGTRYWRHLHRECPIRAGMLCAAARPLLGCGGFRSSIALKPLRSQRATEKTIHDLGIGLLALGTSSARTLVQQGFAGDRITVIPNLGMRHGEDDLARAAAAVPAIERDRVLYLGRLSHAKGTKLLPTLDAFAGAHGLAVHGDGYLRAWLHTRLLSGVGPLLDQTSVAGRLMWARGVVFPSMWPEPGGIVGIDAQLAGVPLAAFATGAALDWPLATKFAVGDASSLANWINDLSPATDHRSPARVAERTQHYWNQVGRELERALAEFASTGTFGGPTAPVETLLGL